jgi:hypothetical protein
MPGERIAQRSTPRLIIKGRVLEVEAPLQLFVVLC